MARIHLGRMDVALWTWPPLIGYTNTNWFKMKMWLGKSRLR